MEFLQCDVKHTFLWMEADRRREKRHSLLTAPCLEHPGGLDSSAIVTRLLEMHGEECGIDSISQFIAREQLSEGEVDRIDQLMQETECEALSPYSGYVSWVLLRISHFPLVFVESLFGRCVFDLEAGKHVNLDAAAALTRDSKQRILEVCSRVTEDLSTGGKQLLERMWRLVIIYAVCEKFGTPIRIDL